ncbi:MAG: MarR family transcriptional regulator [Pelagimonas sp.]|uniref:MarR family transcriptional regulator n=1 Tax=Pelagimonas sp. TaxID=2073170 RepID=UPI003D6A81ED
MILTVLTGDIVDSTKLDSAALDQAMLALSDAASEISGWDSAPSLFGRSSGDGWQLALGNPARGLRAALYLQACLRRLDKSLASRMSLATGEGHLPENQDVNSAHGAVFVSSGRLLDRISGHIHMAHSGCGTKNATLVLADYISQGWTQAQARSLCEMLPPDAGPREEAAKRLGVSRPAVNQALWSAGFPALDTAIKDWEHSE